jgi:histidinol-phosphate aminotransferase
VPRLLLHPHLRASTHPSDCPPSPGYAQASLTEHQTILRPWFTREGGFPTAAVLASISPRTSLIVMSNPNNPTGTPIPKQDMLAVVRAAPHAAVLVDECYFEFMDPTLTMVNEVRYCSSA